MQSDSFLITPAITGLRRVPNRGPQMRVDGEVDARRVYSLPTKTRARANTGKYVPCAQENI